MKITSNDIEKLSRMSADERVAYLVAKETAKKAARLHWISEAFQNAFEGGQ